MSFEYAPVTKGLMVGCALTTIAVGLFDVKHYLHLQLVPHISRHHQYWRLFAHHLAFSNSSDLFVAELLLFNVAVHIERQFGSVKFASFALVSSLLATILEFVALLLFHRLGLNYIASGPSALIFSLLYQHSRIVPAVYDFRIFGVPLNNKSFTYILALQLATSHLPGSLAVALIGILTGQIYRSDLSSLKAYRLPPALVRLSARLLLPLIGSTRPPRRATRARPDEPRTQAPASAPAEQNDEVITTARAPAGAAARARGGAAGAGTGAVAGEGAGAGVVREWVDELTGRGERAQGGIRVPGEEEIAQLMSVFPALSREVVVAALQRSPTIEEAAETLLSSQG